MLRSAGKSRPASRVMAQIFLTILHPSVTNFPPARRANPRTTASAPEGRREGRNRDETHQDVRPRRRGGGRRDGVRRGFFGFGGNLDDDLLSTYIISMPGKREHRFIHL